MNDEKKSVDNSKSNTGLILNLFKNLKIEPCTILPWYPWFKLKKKEDDVWYMSYNIEGNKLKIIYVKINNGDNKYKTFNTEKYYIYELQLR